MYNFHNLSDFEFEVLCKDIMEKKLGINLHIFGKGRDGGIDLTDDCVNKNIVIQVKHYINSTFSNLKTSLQSEIKKVEHMKPKQYYICCSKTLSPHNTIEIYNMFSKYMDSNKNIISLNDINEFLEKAENVDVVRKNYKLWLESTNVLNEVYNQNVFIDCEALLYNIEEESKAFVETNCYRQCKKMLTNDRIVLLIGAPGVGKTVTTKMLALFFASIKYRIRYTTNGDIKDLKKSISSDRKSKEVILLDDCLGQHYFKMKDTQENELLSLIKYISMNPNKVLILNSRVTIFNEAKERSHEFKIFVEDKKIKLHILNMNKVSVSDKGLIFYNHLFYKNVQNEYYNNIKQNRTYVNIVTHKNYTPRIIEFVTRKINYEKIEPKNYAKYILDVLEHPNEIWKEEFSRRLQEKDRIFMTTLYSLTDTTIPLDILKRAYNYRIRNNINIDKTINTFEDVLNRLNASFIMIYDKKGIKEIGVINPSVNDYLKEYLESNKLEVQSIIDNITEYYQIERCLKEEEQEIIKMLKSGEMLKINYPSKVAEMYIIISYICKYKIVNENYKYIIVIFLRDLSNSVIKGAMNRNQIVSNLLQEPLSSYYEIQKHFEYDYVERFFEDMNLDDIDEFFTEVVNHNISMNFIPNFKGLIENNVARAIAEYIDEVDEESYYENYDITDIVNECVIIEEFGYDLDYEKLISIIASWIKDDIHDEIIEKTNILPQDIKSSLYVNYDDININEKSIENFIDLYLKPDEPDESDYDYDHYSISGEMDILDIIFN
ncbi:hypothetical protein CF065_02540 [Clostridium sporogenes]